MDSDHGRGWRAFELARRVVVFLLGVAVTLEGMRDESMTELLIGLVMVGLLPIENLLPWTRPRRFGDG
jgi:hypothetical protein